MRRFIRCPKGHYREAGIASCPECASPKEGPRRCPQCGARVDPEAWFCSNCRNPLREKARTAPALVSRRGPSTGPGAADSFAETLVTREVIIDPRKGLAGGIVVNQGEEALLVAGGVYLAVMGPGSYSSQWILERLENTKEPVTLAVVRKGPVHTTFHMDAILTQDPVRIRVSTEMLVRIDKADLFLANVAKGSGTYSVGDLHAFLTGPVQNAFSDLFGKKSVKELEREGSGLHWKKGLEVTLEHNLKTILDESGLYLSELKSVEYDLKGFNEVVGAREGLFISNEKDAAEAEDLERRIVVRRRTLELLGDLSCTDEQLEEYLLEEEKAKLLKRQELEDIRTALEDRQVDHKIRRDWIIRKLELDQELDYERRKLLGKIGIDREVAEARFALIDVEARLEAVRLENELADEKTRNLARIEMNEQKEASSLKIMEGLVELKKKKDRDAVENALYREKEECEIRLREKEREMEMRRAMGVPVDPPASPGRGESLVYLRCTNPACNAAFSVPAGADVSSYKCPKCSGPVVRSIG